MIIEDLQYIFKKQIDNGVANLYYMLTDGDYSMIDRHPSTQLPSLVTMLDDFQYTGSLADVPRFVK